MYPPNPYPDPKYPFHYRPPPNPSPNPNPSFLSHPPPQIPPRPTSTFNSAPNNVSSSIPDLSSTLSSLTHLLSVSDQTLSSPQTTLLKPQNSEFISCPYNPHHLMPPESLFLHSLRCLSPLLENPSSLLDSLHYPKTLNPEHRGTEPNCSSYPVEDTQRTEHFLSLEHYYNEFSMHFFYKDCPGVVNINDLDGSRKTFSLPCVLSAECANFVTGGHAGGDKHFDESGFRVLASGSLAIKREMKGWTDYPRVCSYDVFCAVLRLNVTKLSDLKGWIISNSLRYGVVLDVYMADHISVLFRLCLKAIRKEALVLMTSKENTKASSFECPVLVQVLTWVASHLSVLFGDMNAKYFALHTFKQCVLEASKGVFFFPLELRGSSEVPEDSESDIRDISDRKKNEEPGDGSEDCNTGKSVDASIDKDVIFISQVAAAVAALHERSWLETRIKALRVSQLPSQLPPRYVRMAAHAFASKRADEERKNRSNYRAIIDHDGLLRKSSSNEDTSKTKTREELLAEERDYKRRRMSYRGKKLKRTPLQVLRDIIDEYTEEIKQAGGIGIFEKAEGGETSLQPSSITHSSVDFHKQRKGNSDFSEVKKSSENQDKKLSLHDQNISSTTLSDDLPQEYEKRGREHHVRREYQECRRSGRDNHSKCPEKHRNYELACKQASHREEQDEVFTRYEHYEKNSSGKSDYHGYKSSFLGPDSESNLGIHKDNHQLNARDSRPGYPYGNHRSNSLPQDSFEDRYDPTECYDMYKDNVYSDVKYVRQEKFDD